MLFMALTLATSLTKLPQVALLTNMVEYLHTHGLIVLFVASILLTLRMRMGRFFSVHILLLIKILTTFAQSLQQTIPHGCLQHVLWMEVTSWIDLYLYTEMQSVACYAGGNYQVASAPYRTTGLASTAHGNCSPIFNSQSTSQDYKIRTEHWRHQWTRSSYSCVMRQIFCSQTNSSASRLGWWCRWRWWGISYCHFEQA